MNANSEALLGALRDFILSGDQAAILQFWKEQNRNARREGLPYYDRLVDPKTGRVIATIDKKGKR